MARFPVSDHCDGTRFFNPSGRGARSFFAVPRWWWQSLFRAAPWPARVPPAPVAPAATPGAGQVAATAVGHATFLLRFPGLTVLTDPVFMHRAGPFGRFGPARVQPARPARHELPRVDVVLLSHNHYDHLDLGALRWLAREHRPLVLAPLGLGAWLAGRGVAGAVELDWWQAHALPGPAGARVVCTPAHHWSSRGPWDRCRTLWGGYWVQAAGGAVYCAGDTGWDGHFAAIQARLGAPDLALLPIGAYEPRWFMADVHLNPAEAVRAHRALGARRSLGMHFGTWRLTDEGIDAPLHELAAARAAQGVAEADFATLRCGETRLFPLGVG